jgi:endonuclease YncB( thermonuclease family)
MSVVAGRLFLTFEGTRPHRRGMRRQYVSGKDEDAKITFVSLARRMASTALACKAAANDRPFRYRSRLCRSNGERLPLSSGQVEVLDGDTIRTAGETFRLVGFDAPETYRARCPSERELGSRATYRLRQLVAGGGLDLERIACSCPNGTEGTLRCNYGRSCGILRARGQDVGGLLIAEGLARAYVCGRTSCPRRKAWCSLLPNSDD